AACVWASCMDFAAVLLLIPAFADFPINGRRAGIVCSRSFSQFLDQLLPRIFGTDGDLVWKDCHLGGGLAFYSSATMAWLGPECVLERCNPLLRKLLLGGKPQSLPQRVYRGSNRPGRDRTCRSDDVHCFVDTATLATGKEWRPRGCNATFARCEPLGNGTCRCTVLPRQYGHMGAHLCDPRI